MEFFNRINNYNMIEELKEIRKRLSDAVVDKDWWVVKSQINKIDTLLYDHHSEVKKLNLPTVINTVCLKCDGTGNLGFTKGQYVRCNDCGGSGQTDL